MNKASGVLFYLYKFVTLLVMVEVCLLKKEFIAENTLAFYFDRKEYQYNFLPGQYVTITLPIIPTDGNGKVRDFTICSSPTEQSFIMIVTKEGKTDAKKALCNLQKGEKVTMSEPKGAFSLQENGATPRVFLAGGIGITPFYSMITYMRAKKLFIPITLIASFSTEEETIFEKELQTIANIRPQIRIIYTVTQMRRSEQKRIGETERISEALIKKYVSNLQKPIFMIAGPPTMIADTEEVLQKMQVPLEHIQVDSFTGY